MRHLKELTPFFLSRFLSPLVIPSFHSISCALPLAVAGFYSSMTDMLSGKRKREVAPNVVNKNAALSYAGVSPLLSPIGSPTS